MIDFWMNIVSDSISGGIVAIGAIGAAVIAAILTIRKFYSQKWWEKKAETYSAISKDLGNLLFCVIEINSEFGGGKKLGSHRKETLSNEYRRRLDSLKVTAAAGDFISSKEVSKELLALVEDLENNSYNLRKEFIGDFSKVLGDYYKSNYQIIETRRRNFNKLAKKDLNI